MSTLRRRLVVLALLLGTLTPAASMSAAPAPSVPIGVHAGYITEYYYYTDSTYTTLVGYSMTGCNPSEGYSWGQVTAYKETVREPCG